MTKTKLLRFVALALFTLSFVVIYAFHVGQVGDSMAWKNGSATISAGSHPAVIAWSLGAIVLFAFLMFTETSTVAVGVPTRRRRILAFLIDFWFSLVALASLGALVPLSLEAIRTGHFRWYFQRDNAVGTDTAIALPSSLFSMILLIFYFVFPLTLGRQTVGCFVMRLKVTPPFGDRGRFTLREAMRRTYYEFTGLCSIFGRKWDSDELGRSWYDRRTNCTVVLIDDD